MRLISKIRIVTAHAASAVVLMTGMSFAAVEGGTPDVQHVNDLVERATAHTSQFLEQFSDVKCTEQVRQEKLGKENKVELKEDSSYDYLVILNNTAGQLSLSESRIPIHEAKKDRKNTSMLVSNGFATLFLIFHPLYADAFKFTLAGEEVVAGHTFEKVSFQHVIGMKSPAALALRGREYPLELTGTAWIDPETGSIGKIDVGIADSLQDVGLKTMSSVIDFAPVTFTDSGRPYWFPSQARVEVETTRQHWRNLHQFSAYKKFSVNTEEKVTQK